jgi:hypothetical protein
VRRLYTGAPKDLPYTIALIASPAIRTSAGTLVADPVISNRPSFHSAVSFVIDNLLRSTEDVLRKGGLDKNIQFVSIFDSARSVTDTVALVQEDTTNTFRRAEIFSIASIWPTWCPPMSVSRSVVQRRIHAHQHGSGPMTIANRP